MIVTDMSKDNQEKLYKLTDNQVKELIDIIEDQMGWCVEDDLALIEALRKPVFMK